MLKKCPMELGCLSGFPRNRGAGFLPNSPAWTRGQCPTIEPFLLQLDRPRALPQGWASELYLLLSGWDSVPMCLGRHGLISGSPPRCRLRGVVKDAGCGGTGPGWSGKPTSRTLTLQCPSF